MKTTVKYGVLYENGKKGKVSVKYDCPDFEEIKFLSPVQPDVECVITIDEQVDDWVTTFDKKEWMNENGVLLIFDWEIKSIKTKSKELVVTKPKITQTDIVGIFASEHLDGQIQSDFIAVYVKMKPTIKDLKFNKQIDIVLKGMDVAYGSALNVYKRLNEFSESLKSEIPRYKEIFDGDLSGNKDEILKDINKPKKLT